MKKFELVQSKTNKDQFQILENGKPIEIDGRKQWFKETARLIYKARISVYKKRQAAARKK